MKTVIAVAAVALFAIATSAVAAGDVAAGKAKAAKCVTCHGANGEGKTPEGKPPYPPIAGLKEASILQDLKDYKSGKRANGPMKMMTGGLSDDDMANLAAYYSSLKGK